VQWTLHRQHPDHAVLKPASQRKPGAYPKPDGKLTLDRHSPAFIPNTDHEHSIGATGALITATAVHELKRVSGAIRVGNYAHWRRSGYRGHFSKAFDSRHELFEYQRFNMTIETIGVVGAGTMGSGIAQIAATAGLKVVLIDVSEAALTRGMAALRSSLERLVAKNTIAPDVASATLARIHTSTEYKRLAEADLVIEAATEHVELKRTILKQIEAVAKQHAIIATNTSSISVTSLAADLGDPSRCVGMHFFNPVPLMPLVEIIRGVQTSPETVDAIHELSRRLGKSPIGVRNSPAFVVNRILVPMINEAFFVLAEGTATAEEIDEGMRLGANHPIGPLALADLVGLDVCLAVLEVLAKDLGDQKYRACPLLRELVAAGRLGRKTRHGVYRYE
jgi:3-hydroxybutyryl-CoA dehydrogenase